MAFSTFNNCELQVSLTFEKVHQKTTTTGGTRTKYTDA